MVCPKCGKTVPDNAKFCGFCGAKLGEETSGLVPKNEKIVPKAVTAVRPVNHEKEAAVIIKPRFSDRRKMLLIAVAVLVVLALAAGAFMLFWGAGSKNAYICLSDGRYELITNLDKGELLEIASSRSDYGDLCFTPDGKYIYYFSKLDSQYGSGTLCRAEYGKMKANSSKNDRYITVVATNASHNFDVLDDGTLLYTNEDGTLYYFDGESSEQIARDVKFYETETDDKGNVLYLVQDENGTREFSSIMYLTNLEKLDQREKLDDDLSALVTLTDEGEIIYTKYTDEGVDLYRMTMDSREPQLMDENVSLYRYSDGQLIYSVMKEKRGLDEFVDGTKASGTVNREDYQIPSYSYYYINSASDVASYDGLCASCDTTLKFFREVLGTSASIAEAAESGNSVVSTACQSFLNKYQDYETNNDGFIEVNESVQADLQLLAQACGAPDQWYLLCIGKRQTSTTYDWDAYYAAVEQAAMWEDLQNKELYNLPIYTLKKMENGESEVILDDLTICSSEADLVLAVSVEDLTSRVKIEEIGSAWDLEDQLSRNINHYSRVLMYDKNNGQTIEVSGQDIMEMAQDGYLNDIACAGDHLFVENGDAVLYVSEIENGVADSFTVLSDAAGILGVEDGKLYYQEGYYTDDEYEYVDLCVWENGETSRLLTDVNPAAIWVYDDGSVVAKTYQDYDGAGELILLNEKGEKTILADEATYFVRTEASEMLYISDQDLYVYDGKEKTRVANDVDRIWCRETMVPVMSTEYSY